MKKQVALLAVSTAVAFCSIPSGVYADVTSPSIKDRGKKYTEERPNTTYYGTGIGARAMEASELRFECERALQDGRVEEALVKSRKAVQLDPGDPGGHLFLARAMTRKLNMAKGEVDEKLLTEVMTEWKMLWQHDADAGEQLEAKMSYMRMLRIAKGLAKQRQLEDKARQRAREEIARQREEQREENGHQAVAGKYQPKKSPKVVDEDDAPTQTGDGKLSDASTDKSDNSSFITKAENAPEPTKKVDAPKKTAAATRVTTKVKNPLAPLTFGAHAEDGPDPIKKEEEEFSIVKQLASKKSKKFLLF